jgi:predicted metal-dependent enzyme (double-stranded beta helix superfamily)
MAATHWLLDHTGQPMPLETEPAPKVQPYRLYRFLTEVEDILTSIPDPIAQLQQIVPRVEYLLTHSPWLQMPMIFPNPETGWEVMMLYDEPDFPLTIQMVAWAAGSCSPIHNHGCWGLVALLNGQERNGFWRRSPRETYPDRIEATTEQVIHPGEIITFLPDAIHQITALGDEPTISFNIYGETDYAGRFEFDPITHRAEVF